MLTRASRIEDPLHDGLKACYSQSPTAQHIIYNKKGLFENVRRPTTDTVDHALTLSLTPPSPKKNIHVLPKNVSPSDFPSPVCRPKDRFPGQSPSGIQVHRTPAQGFTPKTRKRPCADFVKSTHLKSSCHHTGTTTVP